MLLKGFQKFLILHKQLLQKGIQIPILHGTNHSRQLCVHIIRAVLTYRKVICRIVFALACLAHALDIQLHGTCKASHISHDLNIIQCIKIVDSKGIGIPDLAVHHSGFILKNNIFIGLSVLGHSRLLLLAQVNAADPVTLM